MPATVLEIHVPLPPTPDLPEGSYPFPWIEEVGDLLSDLEDQRDPEVFAIVSRDEAEVFGPDHG